MTINIAYWSQQIQNLLHIEHHIPGRIRVKFNNKFMALFSQHKLSTIDQYCSEQGPLYRYKMNATTGSILIEYNPKEVSPKLIEQVFDTDTKLAQQALTSLIALAQNYIRE